MTNSEIYQAYQSGDTLGQLIRKTGKKRGQLWHLLKSYSVCKEEPLRPRNTRPLLPPQYLESLKKGEISVKAVSRRIGCGDYAVYRALEEAGESAREIQRRLYREKWGSFEKEYKAGRISIRKIAEITNCTISTVIESLSRYRRRNLENKKSKTL